MAQAGARTVRSRLLQARPSIPAHSSASACSTTGANRCSNAQGSALVRPPASQDVPCRALQRRLDPDCVVDPRRRGSRSPAANGGKLRQHLTDRQSVSLEPPGKQRPIATGTRPAPRGQPPGSQIGIAFLARQCFEIIGQEFVDGCGTNDQGVQKKASTRFLRIACRIIGASEDEAPRIFEIGLEIGMRSALTTFYTFADSELLLQFDQLAKEIVP